MPKSTANLTPFTANIETRILTFDFGSLWGKNTPLLTISSITSVTCVLASSSPVNDPNPTARVIGSATVGESPTTKQSSQAVYQQFGNLIQNAIYIVTCSVVASDTSEAVLWDYITTDCLN